MRGAKVMIKETMTHLARLLRMTVACLFPNSSYNVTMDIRKAGPRVCAYYSVGSTNHNFRGKNQRACDRLDRYSK